ncbi:ShlB/FhaC/HecB family hemolysin secretion/activation protein [Chromobacterium alticapitis]|nr:ShlB/FhaC/HecB family hemolysin secretion/activation protein [Chromobacterium alticapitis]
MALACWCCVIPARADTQPVPSDLRAGNDDARRLLQNGSSRFDELIRQQRLRQLQSGGSGAERAPSSERAGGRCLPVSGLRLAGITALTRDEVAALGLPHGECLDVAELNRFSRALTALYLGKGYIAARVAAEGPDARGVLTLRVAEGRVAAMRRGEGAPRPGNLFPGMLGQPLNVHDLDQGLDQANRLRSNHVTVDVLPGAGVGESALQLSNQPDSRLSGGLSLDNAGRDSTGRLQAGANLGWDDMSGWSDFLSLSAQTTREDASVRHSRSESLFYSLPYGYWTVSAFVSRADYLNPQQLAFRAVRLSGATAQDGLRLDRVLTRDQGHILTADLQVTQKRIRNYLEDAPLSINSPSLMVLEAGLSRMVILSGGMLQLDGALQRGVRWLGADARDARVDGLPNPQFLKLRLSANWLQTMAWPGGPYQLQSTLSGQASRDSLPGVEQMDVADGGAVRGFRNNALPAEAGWYWRNTLSRRMPLGGWVLTPRAGVDGGRALQRGGEETWQDIAGMDIGAALSCGGLTLDLDYSRPLRKPQGWRQEGHILFARLNWQW